MLSKDKKKKEAKVYFPCDCGSEVMEITYADWVEDDECCFISFKLDAFSAKQTSPLDIIKDRVKLAWRILKGGDYFLYDLITTKEKLGELRDELTEMLKEDE